MKTRLMQRRKRKNRKGEEKKNTSMHITVMLGEEDTIETLKHCAHLPNLKFVIANFL